MDAEFAKRWVADLRDPAHTQCKSKLHDGVGYCCLGRAAVLFGAKLVPMQESRWRGDYEAGTEENYLHIDKETYVVDGTQQLEDDHMTGGEYESLTPDIARRINMRSQDGSGYGILIAGAPYISLADANDKGCTFAQIADWIEANFERL